MYGCGCWLREGLGKGARWGEITAESGSRGTISAAIFRDVLRPGDSGWSSQSGEVYWFPSRNVATMQKPSIPMRRERAANTAIQKKSSCDLRFVAAASIEETTKRGSNLHRVWGLRHSFGVRRHCTTQLSRPCFSFPSELRPPHLTPPTKRWR